MNEKVNLTDADLNGLAGSFISRELAAAAGIRRASDAEARELLGTNGRPGSYAGLLFPYVDPETRQVVAHRLRRDQPDLEQRGDEVVERRKYVSAPGAGNRAYFPPGIREWLADVTLPVVMVEGEKKALAMSAVSWHGLGEAAERPLFLPVGLSGVWSWRGRIGKAPAADGTRSDVRGVIPDLRRINWRGREACVLFDTNVRTSADVRDARRYLAGWLTEQGARVRLADLPPEPGVNGPDDAAAKHGAEYILRVLQEAVPFEPGAMPVVLTASEEEIVEGAPYRGWLRDFERYAQACLPEAPSEYHQIAGLVTAAAILGGKLETDTALRPNLAAVIVGLQGAGKSLPSTIALQLTRPIEIEEAAAHKVRLVELRRELERSKDAVDKHALGQEIERIERAGRPAIVIATQASVEGLLEALSHQPSGLVDMDEFGAFLKDAKREHMRSARENVIKALDARPIFYRRARAQNVDVPTPVLSLLGTVNVESLRLAATDEDLFGGLFNRILLCAPDYSFSIPNLRAGDTGEAARLTDFLRGWRRMKPVTVAFEPGARERTVKYAYQIAPFRRGEGVDITQPEDQVASVAYIRYHTHAQKIAILLAASEDLYPEAVGLTVTLRHVLLAIDLVERFRRQALRLLRHLERRDPLVADAERLLAFIRRHPGRDVNHHRRLTHWATPHFYAVLAELERTARVSWVEEPSTGGRRRRLYFPRPEGK